MDHPLPSNSSSSSSSSSSTTSLSSSSSSSPSSLSFADRILAPLGFALLVLLVAVVSYSFARRRRRVGVHSHHGASLPADDDDDDDESTGGAADEIDAGLSEAAILSYPKLLYSNAKLRRGNPSESCCPICLADYGDGDVLRLLPECNHYFHLKCVDPWLKLHSSCPICRKSLISS